MGTQGPPRDQELLALPLKWLQASVLLSLVGIPLAAGRLGPATVAVITDARFWSAGEHLSLGEHPSLLFKIHAHLCFLPELDLLLLRGPTCQRPPPSQTDDKTHQI